MTTAEGTLSLLRENGEEDFINRLYKNHDHRTVENGTLQLLKGYLADKSDELKDAVYENYKEFLKITRSLEEIEQDFMKIRTQFNSIGTELDELDHRYASEMKQKQKDLDDQIKKKAQFLNITSSKVSSNTEDIETTDKIKQFREDIKYILDAPSLLQVYLAQWDFAKCIAVHDKVKGMLKENIALKNVLKGHAALDEFEEKIKDIVEKLQKRLYDLSLSQKQTVIIIDHLRKVTSEDQSMLIFLAARSQTAKDRIDRELRGENLSIVTQNVCSFAFPLIKTTHGVFTAAFPKAPASCFAGWNISLVNYVMQNLAKKISSKENKQNAIKADCIDRILTLYEIIPQELSLIFIVRKYLSTICQTLSKSRDEIDPKMIQKLMANGLTLPF